MSFLLGEDETTAVPAGEVGIGKLCSTLALLCYVSNVGKTILLCSVLC